MPDEPRLDDYQQQTLREELQTERYTGLSADEAYAEVTARPNAIRLARTAYDWTGELSGLDHNEAGDRERIREIKNRPGFPSKVRRSDFDIVWNELKG